jgi:predicted enzyme related to lactoylglutathione lyase
MGDMQREAEPGEACYTLFMKDGKPVCGGMAPSDVGTSAGVTHWFPHTAVDDVEAAWA